MNLSDYIKVKRGNGVELARKLGKQKSYISQLAVPGTYVDPKLARQIEVATDGQVTRQDLHPDDWREIWPELPEPEKVDA